MLSALLTLLVLGLVAIVLCTVAVAVLGAVFGLAFTLLGLAIKLLPILLLGWLVVKLVKRTESRPRLPASEGHLTPADRDWLDT